AGRRAGARFRGLYHARAAPELGNAGRDVRLLRRAAGGRRYPTACVGPNRMNDRCPRPGGADHGMPHGPDSRTLVTLEQAGQLPAAGTLVLTVNNRLARRLTLDLAGQLRRERQVSELPRVLPLAAWLAEAAGELAFAPQADLPAYRLDSFAAQMVWADAIGAEEAGRVLLDT